MHKSLFNIIVLLALDIGTVALLTVYNDLVGAAAALFISRSYVATALEFLRARKKAADLRKSFDELGIKFYEL